MKSIITFLLFGTICLASCQRQFEPVTYGRDACTHCKMTIMDKRFAAEIITSKGKAIKFDDFGCLLNWVKDENFQDKGALIFVADFNNPGGQFLDARQALFVHGDEFKSPMNGNLAATASSAVAQKLNAASKNPVLTWISLKK